MPPGAALATIRCMAFERADRARASTVSPARARLQGLGLALANGARRVGCALTKVAITVAGDMAPPRSRLALLLIAVLTATALAVSVDAGADHCSSRRHADDAAFAVRAPRVDASAGRLSAAERRDGSSERALKLRLDVVAVAAALLALAVLGRRRTIAMARAGGIDALLWSPETGRAPPSFPLIA